MIVTEPRALEGRGQQAVRDGATCSGDGSTLQTVTPFKDPLRSALLESISE